MHVLILKALLEVLIYALIVVASSAQHEQPCLNAVIYCNTNKDYFPEKISLRYTTTTKLVFSNTHVDVTVTRVDRNSERYRLVRCGCPSGDVPQGTQIIFVPPRRLFVNDGPTIGVLAHSLARVNQITAVGNPAFVYSSAIRSRFATNESTSFESLINRTDIDLSLLYLDDIEEYKDANVRTPFFANGESDESTPLGRSEWIKILALLFDLVESGSTAFEEIERNYENAKALAQRARERPSVLLNYPGTNLKWSLPSEKQYIAALLRDANVDYLFLNDGNNKTRVLPLDQVVSQFRWARYLIHTGPYPPSDSTDMSSLFPTESVNGIVNEDAVAINEALRSLASVRCGNVWVQSKRVTNDDGHSANDFFEYGATRPDLLLLDIVHMVHPSLDESYEPFFSFKLNINANSAVARNCPYNQLLTNKALDGMQYIDIEMEIVGLNRFLVEDRLVENIFPQVAQNPHMQLNGIDAYFIKETRKRSSILVLRAMVQNEYASDVMENAGRIVRSVGQALDSDVMVKLLSVSSVSDGIETVEKRIGIQAVVAAAIFVGMTLFTAILGGLLYFVGSKIGTTKGKNEMKTRYWNELGVRLREDGSF